MPADNLSKEKILGFLRKNKPLFKKKFGVDEIMLFGSYARDEATPESDIDILIDSDETKNLLKGIHAPFGTLSSRIFACYALGLIEQAEFDEMETIRKIRNKLAHNWDNISFESDSVKHLTEKLPWRGPEEYEPDASTKDRFCTAMSMLMVDLVWRTRLVKKERRVLKEWPNKSR